MIELTEAESGELVRLDRGSVFSGAARRMLGEFFDARGWDPRTMYGEVMQVARTRWDGRSRLAKMCGTPAYCDKCGQRAAGVRPSGPWSCKEHWECDAEPLFDFATGFPLPEGR